MPVKRNGLQQMKENIKERQQNTDFRKSEDSDRRYIQNFEDCKRQGNNKSKEISTAEK